MYLRFVPSHKPNYVKLVSDQLDVIRHSFSIENPTPRYVRRKFAPSRLYCISQDGQLLSGLVKPIIKFAVAHWGRDISVTVDDVVKAQISHPIVAQLSRPTHITELRPYQQQACEAFFEHGLGVILHPTAAGKTVTIGTIINSVTHLGQIVVIVPDPGLARQTTDDLIEMGIDGVTQWSPSSPYDPMCKVVVVSHKLCWSRMDTSMEIASRCKVLIVDECHTIKKTSKITKVVQLFNTPNKLALTGTLPDNKIDEWHVIGTFGPVIDTQHAWKLERQGYISPVSCIACQVSYMDFPTKLGFQEEKQWLYENTFRNSIVAKLAGKCHGNLLVLVDRIDHGKLLQQTLSSVLGSDRVFLIQGDVDIDDREDIKKMMEIRNDIVCIAMVQIFRQGINIRNLPYLLLAFLGKRKSRLIQSIGRGRRLHKNKTKLILFDLFDTTKYSAKHYAERLQIYADQKIKTTNLSFKQQP